MYTRLGPGNGCHRHTVCVFVETATVHAEEGGGLLKGGPEGRVEVADLDVNQLCREVGEQRLEAKTIVETAVGFPSCRAVTQQPHDHDRLDGSHRQPEKPRHVHASLRSAPRRPRRSLYAHGGLRASERRPRID